MNAAVDVNAYEDNKDGANVRLLDANAHAGVQNGEYGAGAEAGAEAYVFNFKDAQSHTAVKAFGVSVGAKAGADLEAFFDKEHVFGAEVNATATLVDATGGPFNIRLAIGGSTGATVKDKTVSVVVAGCGVKAGKRVGISVFDTEISFETLSLVGKGWIWGKFDD